MALQSYDEQQPDPHLDAPLWRFMPMNFFQDFMANEELYLRRCDKYIKADPQDGIPTDEYVRKRLGLRRHDINDERTLIVHQGSNRLATEMYYLSCWNLHTKAHEMQMWQQYAKGGVAVQTTFGRLRQAVGQFPDDMHMGRVRYGDGDMTRYNMLQFLFTKGTKFHWETEVRIAMCFPEAKGGQAWNYDENGIAQREAQDHLYTRHPWLFDHKRRRLLLKDVITGIAISPWATDDVASEVKQEWASVGDIKLPVQHLTSSLIPSPEDLARHGGIGTLSPCAVCGHQQLCVICKGCIRCNGGREHNCN